MMKSFFKMGLLCSLAFISLTTNTACSGSAEDKNEVETFVTTAAFERGQYNLAVFSTTAFTIAPTGIYATEEETGNARITTGNLIVGTSSIPVYYDYSTIGDSDAPVAGSLKITLVDAVANASNTDIINGLGLGTTTRIVGVEIYFDFASGRCNVLTSGYQTRSSVSGSADVLVNIAYNDQSFLIVAPSSF